MISLFRKRSKLTVSDTSSLSSWSDEKFKEIRSLEDLISNIDKLYIPQLIKTRDEMKAKDPDLYEFEINNIDNRILELQNARDTYKYEHDVAKLQYLEIIIRSDIILLHTKMEKLRKELRYVSERDRNEILAQLPVNIRSAIDKNDGRILTTARSVINDEYQLNHIMTVE